tara:strand:+ start:66 stop:554 length:489 start_codon:yes stop_codon:yes gene_type:complete
MSRLESAIRRLQAQKIALDWAISEIQNEVGLVLEFGLGNGRTFDHMRALLPGRDIYVFERKIAAHPDCIPEKAFQFVGDFLEMLPVAVSKLGPSAILVHLDIGTGEKTQSLQLAGKIAPLVEKLLRPNAIVVSDQEVANWAKKAAPLPDNLEFGRIYIYHFK